MSINKVDILNIRMNTTKAAAASDRSSDISVWFNRIKERGAEQAAGAEQSTDTAIYPTRQSKKTADCWLLSGLNALNNTEFGKQAIKDAIKIDSNETRTITLKGYNNKQITVTRAEIEAAQASGLYSTGDLNVIAFEIAIEKLKNEIRPRSEMEQSYNGLAINWGESNELFYLITGKKCTTFSDDMNLGKNPNYVENSNLDVSEALEIMAENKDSIAMVCSFRMHDGIGKYEVDGVSITPQHAYAVVGVEKDENGVEYVMLKNPYDASQTIKITKENFMQYVRTVDAIADEGVTLPTKRSRFEGLGIRFS